MNYFMKIGFTILFLVVAVAFPAGAGSFEDGYAAYSKGDYATAMSLWRPLAEQGDAAAQNNMGMMYKNGDGVPQDIDEAVKWFRLAAENGPVKNTISLGLMYLEGDGVAQDIDEAVKWLRMAVDRGDAETQTFLGGLYYSGNGVTQDYVEAAKLYRMAAEQGQPDAQSFLANSYLQGHGVPQDFVQALVWSYLAGNEEMQTLLYGLMTPDQIVEAEMLANEWKPQ